MKILWNFVEVKEIENENISDDFHDSWGSGWRMKSSSSLTESNSCLTQLNPTLASICI